ncbi:MAG: helix-turn-helix transcriptional regulator [Candidatus Dormibacteria bacterium]
MDEAAGENPKPTGTGRRPRLGKALSSREEQVVALAESGKTNREVAEILGLSERTIESHIRRIIQKRGGIERLRRGRRRGKLLHPGEPAAD